MTASQIRVATFNASLNRSVEGRLVDDLTHVDSPADADQALRVSQIKTVGEIIQRVNPDIILINEFDYLQSDPMRAVDLLRDNVLEKAQNTLGLTGALANTNSVDYPYAYIAPSNTGIASGFDLNNNGAIVTTPGAPGYGDDSFGFGNFPGQFGMLILSKYEIKTDDVRTFQNFLWKDMPGARLPDDASTPAPRDFYSEEELAAFRLSSKSHWDVPIDVNGETVHILAAHPTPPVFDGPEDRNGTRNADEIRLWADYVTPGRSGYIYDDEGQTGGLAAGERFVIMGDQNSDPRDGDSLPGAIQQLLNKPSIDTSVTPSSDGGPDARARQGLINTNHISDPRYDTADFADGFPNGPGNLRADYVLPSVNGLDIVDSGVFWPVEGTDPANPADPLFPLAGNFTPALGAQIAGFQSSDHRLVYADLEVTPSEASPVELLGQARFATGFIPNGSAGTVEGVPVQVGGLSGISYDASRGVFYAISDDRSSLAPARFYTLTVDVNDGTPFDNSDVAFTNVTAFKRPDGSLFPTNGLDPEGIAFSPDGTVFASSEGEANAVVGRITNPFVREYDLGGNQIGQVATGAKFNPIFVNTPADADPTNDVQVSGVRNNLAFESLTLDPSGLTGWFATENALFQDGPASTLFNGTASRIASFDSLTGQVTHEYVYVTDPVIEPTKPAGQFSTNGLVELLATGENGVLLALERSFSTGATGVPDTLRNGTPEFTGNNIRLYEVRIGDATDVRNFNTINNVAGIQAVEKTLLVDFDALGIAQDNIEGMTFGPTLADGRHSLIFVSDNNFGTTQFTQVVALALDLDLDEKPVVHGTTTNDTRSGGAAGEIMLGYDGDDRLLGGQGDDILRGGAGRDTLEGGAGHDTLEGGLGRDILIGGADADIFVLADRDAVDTIRDFNFTGGDRIELAIRQPDGSAIGFDDIRFTAQGKNLLLQIDVADGTEGNFVNIATLTAPVGIADPANSTFLNDVFIG